MKNFLFVVIVVFFFGQNVVAQSVAINTIGATANTSSILDVSSTTKGVLVPRMTKAQKNAIATPAIGLLVYQALPDSVGFHYYNGSLWVWLNPSGGASNDWSLTGNAGTDTAVNFIGTTTNMPLAFKVNNEKSGLIENNIATANTFLGFRSGRFNTGTFNTAFGYRALADTITGTGNTAFGAFTLANNTTGIGNTAIGASSLLSNTVGYDNTAIGYSTLSSNINGTDNTGIGFSSLTNNTTGRSNTAVGSFALLGTTTGRFNTAIGTNALSFNTSGERNVAQGASSLDRNTTGSSNTAIGFVSMNKNTTGNYNVAIGDSAAYSSTNLSHLIAIGSKALFANTSGTNLTALGDSALYSNTTGYKNIAIGNSALVKNTTGFQNIGIGYRALKDNLAGVANIAIGDSALFTNTTGNDNVAIGKASLQNNTFGYSNIAIGLKTMQTNIAGSRNIAIGDESLGVNTFGIQNIAIGYKTIPANTIGSNNTGMGFFSLKANTSGETNSAYGLYSLYNNTTGDNNTGLGVRAGFGNTTGNGNSFLGFASGNIIGNSNVGIGIYALGGSALPETINNTVAIGDSALFNIQTGAISNTAIGSKSLFSNTVGNFNTGLGYKSMYKNTTGSYNVAIGDSALHDNTVGTLNTAIGTFSLLNNTVGLANTAIGNFSMFDNISGAENTALGYASLLNNITGFLNVAVGEFTLANRNGTNNIAIGVRAGSKSSGGVTSFQDNIFIGSNSGSNSTGSNNIFIGDDVGTGFTASNILSIDNTNTSTPLIFGNFATDLLRINGTLNINNQYSLPTTDGSVNQVLYTNGSGTVGWANTVGSANNGLTITGSNVALGGNLINNTTINQGNFNLNYNLNGTGDFKVYNVLGDALYVKNTGFVGFNTNNPQFRLHVINLLDGDQPFGRGIMIENTNTTTTGEASIAFKNAGPNGIPASRAWMAGMNNFTNFVVAYGDSLKAANVKMKIDTSGNVGINTLGNPPNSRLDVKGSFGYGIEVISVNYTATDDDHTIIIASSVGAAALTVTLPGAGTCPRREYVIVNRNASAKTVTSYNDFSGTSTAIPGNGSITLQSNGSNWFRTR